MVALAGWSLSNGSALPAPLPVLLAGRLACLIALHHSGFRFWDIETAGACLYDGLNAEFNFSTSTAVSHWGPGTFCLIFIMRSVHFQSQVQVFSLICTSLFAFWNIKCGPRTFLAGHVASSAQGFHEREIRRGRWLRREFAPS